MATALLEDPPETHAEEATEDVDTPPVDLSAAEADWVTAEQVAAMSHNYPRVELWYGQLKVKMPARPRKAHGEIQAEFTRVLGNHVKPNKLGRVFNESGVLLRREPDVLYGPDIAFYAHGKGEGHKTYFVGGPDLVVEILSPTNTRREVAEKIDIYIRYGTRLVWVVNIPSLKIVAHRPDVPPVTLSADDLLDGGDVLPGFSCRVGDLFV